MIAQAALSTPRRAGRIDLERLKAAHPIEDVVRRYGIDLRRQGRAAVARCPFHADHGRPNFYVWGDTQSWFCFRCNVGGDVVSFVERAEGLSFREAVERLDSARMTSSSCSGSRVAVPELPASAPRGPATYTDHDPDGLAALQAATSLYHQRLLTDPQALGYLERRGIDRGTVQACLLGYAAGDELVPFLRWRKLPLGPAVQAGLLDHAGREFLAGRIVVPELRQGHPVWLVGRLLEPASGQAGEDAEQPSPKYLALRGARPLLGAECVQGSAAVIVTEGVFDVLMLRRWGYPAVALVGTHTRPDIVEQLRGFQRLYLVLDQDDAGLEATLRLAHALGSAAIPVALPDGIKDVAELAPRADGRAVFARALLEAVGAPATGVSTEPDQLTDAHIRS